MRLSTGKDGAIALDQMPAIPGRFDALDRSIAQVSDRLVADLLSHQADAHTRASFRRPVDEGHIRQGEDDLFRAQISLPKPRLPGPRQVPIAIKALQHRHVELLEGERHRPDLSGDVARAIHDATCVPRRRLRQR
jgi:hypothetical protein